MDKKGKSGRELIRLVSTADTGFFYTTSKNRKRTPDKLVLKKYDPVVRKHVDFKESKILGDGPCRAYVRSPGSGRSSVVTSATRTATPSGASRSTS